MRRVRALAAGAILLAAPAPARAAHPNALWRVVHSLCVPAKRMLGVSAPCTDVDLAKGVAIVPDLNHPSHLILTPTRRIAGVESAELQRAGAPNYWRYAWEARPFLERRAGRPLAREEVALAVNSADGRSQNQLHIHIACSRAAIREALAAKLADFSTDRWTPWPELPGRDYRVRLVRGETPGGNDPFRILAGTDAAAAARMRLQTLALLAVRLPDGSPGFLLLADTASPDRGDSGHGEELLDHTCEPPAPSSPLPAPAP